MRFNLRKSAAPPIAADLGASSIKLLQLNSAGDSVTSALEGTVEVGPFNVESHLASTAEALTRLRDSSSFSGKRLVVSMPASMVTMMHLRINAGEDFETALHTRLQDLGANPMVRTKDVNGPWKTGRGGRELLCTAMPREVVLRYVAIMHELGFEVAGVYAPASMLLRAFRHIHQRASDQAAGTVYVHLEQSTVTVAFGHGT